MEKEGYIRSAWEGGGPGPQRRVYMITEKGETELDTRVGMMKTRKARIEKFIFEYNSMHEGNKQ